MLLLALLLCSPCAASARQSKPLAPVRHGYGLYRITAYFPTGNLTATGTTARYGELAVDPNVVPLGSHVHIDGIGNFRAEDTGGAVWGRHLDVLVYTWPQAYWVQGSGYRKAYWWR